MHFDENQLLYTSRLYRYRPPTFMSAGEWKESWAMLSKEGEFAWFNDKHCSHLRGTLNIREVANQMAIGNVATSKLREECPPLPFENPHMITFPAAPKSKKKKAMRLWFCAKSEHDLIEWLQHWSTILGKKHLFDSLVPEVRKAHATATDQLHFEPGGTMRGSRKAPAMDWGDLWEAILSAKSDLPAAQSSQPRDLNFINEPAIAEMYATVGARSAATDDASVLTGNNSVADHSEHPDVMDAMIKKDNRSSSSSSTVKSSSRTESELQTRNGTEHGFNTSRSSSSLHYVDVQIHDEPKIQSQASHTSESTENSDHAKAYQEEEIAHEVQQLQQKSPDEFHFVPDQKSSRSSSSSSTVSQPATEAQMAAADGFGIQQAAQNEIEDKLRSSRSSSNQWALESQAIELQHIHQENEQTVDVQHLNTENNKSSRSSSSSSTVSQPDKPDSVVPNVPIFSHPVVEQHVELQWPAEDQNLSATKLKSDHHIFDDTADQDNHSSRSSTPIQEFGQATETPIAEKDIHSSRSSTPIQEFGQAAAAPPEFENWSTVADALGVEKPTSRSSSSSSSQSDHEQDEFPSLPPLPTCPPPDDSFLSDEGVQADIFSEDSPPLDEVNISYGSKALNGPQLNIKFPTVLLKNEQHHQETTKIWLEENEQQMEQMEADRWEYFETKSSTTTRIHRQQEHSFKANGPTFHEA